MQKHLNSNIENNAMLLLKQKPSRILLCLQDERKHLSKIAKEAGVTYPYLYSLAQVFAAKGLVTVEKIGKFKYLELTEKGKQLVVHLKEVYEFEKS